MRSSELAIERSSQCNYYAEMLSPYLTITALIAITGYLLMALVRICQVDIVIRIANASK